jgi:hypothetical protein
VGCHCLAISGNLSANEFSIALLYPFTSLKKLFLSEWLLNYRCAKWQVVTF